MLLRETSNNFKITRNNGKQLGGTSNKLAYWVISATFMGEYGEGKWMLFMIRIRSDCLVIILGGVSLLRAILDQALWWNKLFLLILLDISFRGGLLFFGELGIFRYFRLGRGLFFQLMNSEILLLLIHS